MFSLQPSLDVMLCGIALLNMYSNHWFICTTFSYSGHDWPFLYLWSFSIFNLFMFMFFLLLLLFQNKGRMFFWNVGTPCCTTLHHMCRNYFSTDCCKDLKSRKAESCGRNSRCCLYNYIFEFIQIPPSVCMAKHFNPYPTAFPYGNGMVLHFYQQQESSTTKTVHKVINRGLKAYVQSPHTGENFH